jgi:choline dehydrogenase-like flavoprotein
LLRPNLRRSNLTLLLNTRVTRIVFDGDRASGWRFSPRIRRGPYRRRVR